MEFCLMELRFSTDSALADLISNHIFVIMLILTHPVDCEVVAEGKTVAAPVQKTTRALNTTTSR